jgi:uncharacterized protein involved in cysteine biosynthesis
MSAKWLIVIVMIGTMTLSMVTNAIAGHRIVITYDTITKKVEVVDEEGKVALKEGEYRIIDGVPEIFLKSNKPIRQNIVRPIISNVSSDACTCYGEYGCVGHCTDN